MKAIYTLFLMIALVAGSHLTHASEKAPDKTESFCGLESEKNLDERDADAAKPSAQPAAVTANQK